LSRDELDVSAEEARLDELLAGLGAVDPALDREVERSYEATRGVVADLLSGADPRALADHEQLGMDTAPVAGQEEGVTAQTTETPMVHDLDRLLNASAPPATADSPELRRALANLVADSEAEIRPGRLRGGRRLLVGAAAAVLTFGAGAAASAAGLLPDWGPDVVSARHVQVVTSVGRDCQVTYTVTPVGSAGEAGAQALRASQQFLRSFDVRDIDVSEATSAYRRSQAAERAGADAPAPDTADQTRVLAVGAALYSRLSDRLTAQDIDPHLVTITSFDNCDYQDQR